MFMSLLGEIIMLTAPWVQVRNFQNPELLKFKFKTLQYHAFKIIIFQAYMVNCL